MMSSHDECGIEFLKDEALLRRLKMDLWFLKEGALRINFKMLCRDEFFLEEVGGLDRDRDRNSSSLVSSCRK